MTIVTREFVPVATSFTAEPAGGSQARQEQSSLPRGYVGPGDYLMLRGGRQEHVRVEPDTDPLRRGFYRVLSATTHEELVTAQGSFFDHHRLTPVA